MVQINRPAPLDVTKANTADTLYIAGDADTDGSVRLVLNIFATDGYEVQSRANGVWNGGSAGFGPGTLYIGLEPSLGGVGPYLNVQDRSETLSGLYPYVEYDATTGSADVLTTAHASALVTEYEFQTDDSATLTGDPIEFRVNWIEERSVVSKVYLIPAVAPSGEVSITVRRGSETGEAFFYRTYDASLFVADTEVALDVEGGIEFTDDSPLYWFIEDEGATLELKAESLFGEIPYLKFDYQTITRKTITPDEDGGATQYLVFDNNGYAMCDNFGDAVLADPNEVELEPQAIDAPTFSGALTFDDDQATANMSAAPVSLYRFTGTAGATLTLSDDSKGYADEAHVWRFIVKDEGGNCTASPLTIVPESGSIEGTTQIQIVVDYGSVELYTDGTNFYSIVN